MNGCHQIGIKPAKLDKNGEVMDTVYIDIEQLKVMPGGIANELKGTKISGGEKSFRDLPK